MFPRLWSSCALLLCAIAVLPAPSAGQGSADGQFGITPARRDLAARPPVGLAPTRVSNTTETEMDVTVFTVVLEQAVSGQFVFSEEKVDLNAANNILTPTQKAFKLTPGQSRDVGLRWNVLPRGDRTAYIGVIFQAVPVVDGEPNLAVTNRLLGVNLLRLPGRYRSAGRFDGMQVRQAPEPRVLRFIPRVENTGEIHDTPEHGRLVIETPSGRDLYEQRWTGDLVLPGAKRDFPIDVRKVFPKGKYVAAAVMDFGESRHQVIRQPFTLTGPNTLPSGQILVDRFNANGIIGKPAELRAVVRNTGTAPAGTTVSVELFHTTKDPAKPIARERVPFEDVPARGEEPLELDIGTVEPGHYRAVLRYRDSTDVVRTLSSEFEAAEERSWWDNFKRWIEDHAALVVGGLALLLLALIIAWFLRRQRRLERQLAEREDPAAVAAPVAEAPPASPPAPPPPAGVPTVNVNTASAEELQQLPGVGPKAAARIIEHREEYGAFAGLDDLARVEGFDAARVEGLRDRAVT